LAVLALAGCRALPPPAPLPEASAAQIISRLQARQEGLTSFAARGRLTLLSPGRNATGSAALKGKFPENLRVEVFDLLGRSMFSMATDGRRLELYFPREGKYFKGPATPAHLAAFIPPGVSLSQTLRLLVGDLPLSAGAPSHLRFDPGAKLYVLEWQNEDGSLKERLWVDPEGFFPRKEEWYGPDGRLAFSAELGDYDRLAPGRPQQLKVLTSASQWELRLAYKEFALNPPLTPADLAVPKPPGVAELPLKP
jgi:hypothetical protein